MTQVLIRLAIYAALAGGLYGTGYYHGHRSANSAWQLKWDARNEADARAVETRNRLAIPEIVSEAKAYAKTTAAPVTDAPHVLVCDAAPARRKVQSAPAPGSVADGTPAVREKAARDIGAPVVSVGRDADALVMELHNYINRVCRATP